MAFPNVPFAPGVPPLFRDPLANLPALILQTRDLINFITGFAGPAWGLFQSGRRVIDAESVVSFDYKQNWNLPTFPLEQGAFETYDKVELPFDVKFRFSMGGSIADRQALLASVDQVANSLELFDAVTPERVYPNVNVSHYDYRRVANSGVGLLVVDVWCVKIRVTAQTAFSNTQSPSAQGVRQGGTVQNSAVPSSQLSQFGGGGFF